MSLLAFMTGFSDEVDDDDIADFTHDATLDDTTRAPTTPKKDIYLTLRKKTTLYTLPTHDPFRVGVIHVT